MGAPWAPRRALPGPPRPRPQRPGPGKEPRGVLGRERHGSCWARGARAVRGRLRSACGAAGPAGREAVRGREAAVFHADGSRQRSPRPPSSVVVSNSRILNCSSQRLELGFLVFLSGNGRRGTGTPMSPRCGSGSRGRDGVAGPLRGSLPFGVHAGWSPSLSELSRIHFHLIY